MLEESESAEWSAHAAIVAGVDELERSLSRSIRVAVVDSDRQRQTRYLDLLGAAGLEASSLGASPYDMLDSKANREEYDVAVVGLEEGRLSALTFLFANHHAVGAMELLLLIPRNRVFRNAMVDAGFRTIAHRDLPDRDLLKLVKVLAVRGRAKSVFRSAHLAATRYAERLDWDGSLISDSSTSNGLYSAEGRFRESFLRAMLSISRTKREAAKRAGVPYRTFLDMLERLGIEGREGLSEQRSE